MLDLAVSVLVVAGQLYAIMDPVGVLPTYTFLVSGCDESERGRLLRNAFFAILGLMFAAAFAGRTILDFFGISVDSVRFGGGILLLVLAIDMLGGEVRSKVLERLSIEDAIISPISTPLLVGPGTITMLLVLSASMPAYVVVTGILIAAALSYLTLKASDILIALLGRNGVRAMGRVMAVVIAAVAAEMIHAALVNWGIANR